jgi:hypothetical protein
MAEILVCLGQGLRLRVRLHVLVRELDELLDHASVGKLTTHDALDVSAERLCCGLDGRRY